jgi:hypothetical protein
MCNAIYNSIITGASLRVNPAEALALKTAAEAFNHKITGQENPIIPLSPLSQAIVDKAFGIGTGQGVYLTDRPEEFGFTKEPRLPSTVSVYIDGDIASLYTEDEEADGESVARLAHGFLAATQRDETLRIQSSTCERLGETLTDVRVEYWLVDMVGIKRITPWQFLKYEEELMDMVDAIHDPEALARFGLLLIDQTGLPKSLVITSRIDTPRDVDFAQAVKNVRRIVGGFDNLLAGCFDPVVAERREDLRALARILDHVEAQIKALQPVEA